MGGEESFGDDDRDAEMEDHVDRVVDGVLLRHIGKVVLRMVLVLPVLVVGTVGIRVLAVVSLWHLSGPPRYAIALLLIVDLARRTALLVGSKRESRPPTRADHGPSNPRVDVIPRASRTWRERISSASWWFDNTLTAGYLLVAGVMLARWASPLTAVVSVITTAIGVFVAGELLDRWRPELNQLNQFLIEMLHDRRNHEHNHDHDDE